MSALQTQCKKLLSNKNGTYRFVNIFLISGGDNIYILIVLLQIFLLNYPVSSLVNLLSIAFSSFYQHRSSLKFSFFIFQKGPQWKYSFLAFFALSQPSQYLQTLFSF